MTFSQVLQLASIVGPTVFMAVLVFGNYRRGDSQAAKEALELREKQIQALKDAINENKTDSKEREDKMRSEITALTGKVGELTGNLSARDGEIKRLNDIIANRNPEMEQFFIQVASVTDILPKLLETMTKLDQHITKHKD